MSESRPTGPEEDRVLDHDYDGIQEYDNPMPRWWLNVLYVTVVFSVLYVLNFIPGVGSGSGRIARYEAEMAKAQDLRDAEAKAHPVTAEGIVALTHDAAALARGRDRFTLTCAQCHRADGGGNIGPNLTDDYWLHGGEPARIATTVAQGVPAKGMPAWGNALKPDELTAVTAYVLTLRGSHPEHPKEPQGQLEASASRDSTVAAAAASAPAKVLP